tara:strand:+ start:11075 stop:11740 length:666 start_codon:yes stop_codon:yes gene_type:complete
MESTNIQDLWKQHEAQLESTRKINSEVLKTVHIGQAQATLRRLFFLPISTLLFYLLVAAYGSYFSLKHIHTWYFVFSGSLVVAGALLYCGISMLQLKQLLSIDYTLPVVQLQKDIAALKPAFITNLKIAAWILPFGPFIGLFVVQALFNIDLTTYVTIDLLASFSIITIVLEIIGWFAARAFSAKNSSKKWMNWWLKGSGSQVDEALAFLNQLKAFEEEVE